MRRATCLLAAALLGLAGTRIGAQATVVYAEGRVEVAEGGLWREVALGSELPVDATVRVAEGGLAELASGELRITLSRPGSYYLPELVSTSLEVSRWRLAAVVLNKARVLFRAAPRAVASSMGVRGQEAPGAGDLGASDWATEEGMAADRGRTAFDQGRYAEAAAGFREAAASAEPAARPEHLLDLGLALALAGENGAAQRALDQIEDPESLPRYGEYVLLAARLAIDGLGYAQAEQLLLRFLEGRPTHSAAPEALLLAAFCSRQLGRPEEAAVRLLKVIDLDPGSEAAAAARDALVRL